MITDRSKDGDGGEQEKKQENDIEAQDSPSLPDVPEEGANALATKETASRRHLTAAAPNHSAMNESLGSSTVLSSSSSNAGPSTKKNLRALQWPPRSPCQIAKNAWLYVKGVAGPLEVLFWLGILYSSYHIGVNVMQTHIRPPPYQVMENGEVVLDMIFNRPKLEESFPRELADLLTVYLPLCIFWLVGNFLGPDGDAHAAFCVYLLAIGIKILLVECVKNYVGYWRPYFYSMCDFNTETLQCNGLDDDDGPKQYEPWQSFPGGHAATAMCSMTSLSLYFIGKIVGSSTHRHLTSNTPHAIWTPSFPVKLAVLAAASPPVLGIFISTSRIRDEWHHPADVLAGMGLGIATALLSHTLYYPSEWGEYAGIPRTTVEIVCASNTGDEETRLIRISRITFAFVFICGGFLAVLWILLPRLNP